jgi:hypothetical protein
METEIRNNRWMMIIKIILMYNEGDDLHKINFNLEFITIEKLVIHFDG